MLWRRESPWHLQPNSNRPGVRVENALRVFMTHDWSEELEFLSELERARREYCPPGIGFVDPAGPILHVCPSAGGRALVPYHPKAMRKLFGFIPTFREGVQTKQGVQQSDLVELIHSFFAGRHDCILRNLRPPNRPLEPTVGFAARGSTPSCYTPGAASTGISSEAREERR